jgi:hypothetical protein
MADDPLPGVSFDALVAAARRLLAIEEVPQRPAWPIDPWVPDGDEQMPEDDGEEGFGE